MQQKRNNHIHHLFIEPTWTPHCTIRGHHKHKGIKQHKISAWKSRIYRCFTNGVMRQRKEKVSVDRLSLKQRQSQAMSPELTHFSAGLLFLSCVHQCPCPRGAPCPNMSQSFHEAKGFPELSAILQQHPEISTKGRGSPSSCHDRACVTVVPRVPQWCPKCHSGAQGVTVMARMSLWCPGCHSGAQSVTVMPRVSQWCPGCHSNALSVTMMPRVPQWCPKCHSDAQGTPCTLTTL